MSLCCDLGFGLAGQRKTHYTSRLRVWGEIRVLGRHIAKAYHAPMVYWSKLSALEKYMIASAVLKDDYLQDTGLEVSNKR